MNFKQERALVIIGAIVIIGLAIGLPFLTKPCDNLLPNFALSQLTFSAVAFFIVFLALYFTIVQLRKSMAKPKLEVIFTENNKSEISIDITRDTPQGVEVQHELKLSVINKGNAITKLFQIDFTVPILFHPRTDANSVLILGIPRPPLNPPLNMSEGNTVISFCSYEKVYCFVNKPARIHTLLLGTFAENYDRYPNEFRITYRVFGDWAETQEGVLKVICKKQQEVS